jgi:hypothetical protein
MEVERGGKRRERKRLGKEESEGEFYGIETQRKKETKEETKVYKE